MTNTLTISRELLERLQAQTELSNDWDEVQALLCAPAVERQAEGRRERFQKWVLATEHPVLGFLDGHWLERGDDREGYANEYVQGLWVAFKQFTSLPAPIAVVLPERRAVSEQSREQAMCANSWNACLDKVKEMNR